MSYPCPICHHTKTAVTDSRTVGRTIRRRRLCPSCGTRFTTRETLAGRITSPVMPPAAEPPVTRPSRIAGGRYPLSMIKGA